MCVCERAHARVGAFVVCVCVCECMCFRVCVIVHVCTFLRMCASSLFYEQYYLGTYITTIMVIYEFVNARMHVRAHIPACNTRGSLT